MSHHHVPLLYHAFHPCLALLSLFAGAGHSVLYLSMHSNASALVLRRLLAEGVDVNERHDGCPPLSTLLLNGSGDVAGRVMLLLQHDAVDLTAVYDDRTPAEWARHRRYSYLAQLIDDEV